MYECVYVCVYVYMYVCVGMWLCMYAFTCGRVWWMETRASEMLVHAYQYTRNHKPRDRYV